MRNRKPISKRTLSGLALIVIAISVFAIVIHEWLSPPAVSDNQLVFTGKNGELYLIKADGSQQLPVTHANWRNIDNAPPPMVYKLPGYLVDRLAHSTFFHHASWSSDGLWIAYASNHDIHNSDHFDIYVVAPDGSKQTRITNLPTMWVAYPTWSPDGSKLTFAAAFNALNWDIFSVNVDGTNMIKLTESGASELEPEWSPDGKQIVFISDRDGNAEIYIMNIDGSEQKRLTYNNDSDIGPSWSSDGQQIVFSSSRDGNSEIYVMNNHGSSQRRLTVNQARDDQPSWSPDGEYIVFISNRDGNDEIYVMNKDGSDQIRLTDTSESERSPDWGP